VHRGEVCLSVVFVQGFTFRKCQDRREGILRNACSFVILRKRFCVVVRYVVSSGMLLSVGKVQEKEEGSTPPSPPGFGQEEGGSISPLLTFDSGTQ